MNQPTHKNLPKSFVKELNNILGKSRFSVAKEDCWPYGYDYSQRHACPDAISFPESTDEVAQIIRLCNTHNIAVIGRGGATNATGACVPVKQSIILSFERMDKILSLNEQDRYIECQPGVLNSDVQNKAKEVGSFWPPCPTSSAYSTIGGNIACNASGARALKYGSCRENVLGLTAVTGSGNIIKTGVKTTKTSVGYDLTRLLIGSEGTLAIVTEATLKIVPQPDVIKTIAVNYPSMETAAQAITSVMSQANTPYSLEFMDEGCLKILHDIDPDTVPKSAKAMLIIEVSGSLSDIKNTTDNILNIAKNNCINYIYSDVESEREKIWHLRKTLPASLRKLAPKKVNEDIVVPVSAMPKFIEETQDLSRKYSLPIVNFGHAGNGNIHTNLLFDPDNKEEANKIQPCLRELFKMVIKLNGSLSGEHGIGLEKQPFINEELDPNSIHLMQGIKSCFDPNNILNPNKIFLENSIEDHSRSLFAKQNLNRN